MKLCGYGCCLEVEKLLPRRMRVMTVSEARAVRQLELAIETAHHVGIPAGRSLVVQTMAQELVKTIEGELK